MTTSPSFGSLVNLFYFHPGVTSLEKAHELQKTPPYSSVNLCYNLPMEITPSMVQPDKKRLLIPLFPSGGEGDVVKSIYLDVVKEELGGIDLCTRPLSEGSSKSVPEEEEKPVTPLLLNLEESGDGRSLNQIHLDLPWSSECELLLAVTLCGNGWKERYSSLKFIAFDYLTFSSASREGLRLYSLHQDHHLLPDCRCVLDRDSLKKNNRMSFSYLPFGNGLGI